MFSKFTHFYVGNGATKYISSVGHYSGTGGAGLPSGYKFTTYD